MKQLTSSEFESFLKAKRVAVVHFDAEWDGYRKRARMQMNVAEQTLGHRVSFAEVDCVDEKALAKSVGLLNIPGFAYFINEKLIAIHHSVDHNVTGKLDLLLNERH